MYLATETDAVFRRLKESATLENAIVIKAYPYTAKPPRLQKPVISVSPDGLTARCCSLGQRRLTGSYGIHIRLTVPHNLGTPVADSTLEAVLAALDGSGFNDIEVSGIRSTDAQDCFTADCKVYYRSQLGFTEGKLWTQQQT